MKDSLKQFYNNNSPSRQTLLTKEAKERIKFSLLAKIKNLPKEELHKQTSNRLVLIFKSLIVRSYVIAPLVILLLVSGSAIASADSLPGDVLYPVKRSVEAVSILIAPTELEKTDLQIKFAKKRIAEFKKLKEIGSIKNDNSSDKPNNTKLDSDSKINASEQNRTNPDIKKQVRDNQKARLINPQIQKRIEDDAKSAEKLLKDKNILRIRNDEDDEDEDMDDDLKDDRHKKDTSKFKTERVKTEIEEKVNLEVRLNSKE